MEGESSRGSSCPSLPWSADKILSFHEASRGERSGTLETTPPHMEFSTKKCGDLRLRRIRKVVQLISWEGHDKTSDTVELFLQLHRPQLLESIPL